MSYRNKTIDLHYLDEIMAISKVELALWELEQTKFLTTFTFITGQGDVLRGAVIAHLEDEGYEWDYEFKNAGAIVVYKK